MYYSRIRNVKQPVRGHSTDAGIDFFVPEFDNNFVTYLKEKNQKPDFEINDEEILLYPHQSILIPSGIKVNLERTRKELTSWEGIMLVVHNKSGVGSKKQLDRLAEVIDESYQGEIHINLVNTSNRIRSIKPNEKIIQLILEETVYLTPQELKEEDLYSSVSERGSGGFGHTNDK